MKTAKANPVPPSDEDETKGYWRGGFRLLQRYTKAATATSRKTQSNTHWAKRGLKRLGLLAVEKDPEMKKEEV